MFAVPSSTTATEIHNNSYPLSPISTNSIKSVVKTTTTTTFTESDKGFTILVPANVRFSGENMHLDLKLDETTLANSEISNTAEKVIPNSITSSNVKESNSNQFLNKTELTANTSCRVFNFSSTSSNKQLSVSINNNVCSLSSTISTKKTENYSPLLMDATIGESNVSLEDSKLQSVSSTTVDKNGQNFTNANDEFFISFKSFEDTMPVSSSMGSIDDSTADTTVSTSAGFADLLNKDEIENISVETKKLEENIENFKNKSKDECIPSSSTPLLIQDNKLEKVANRTELFADTSLDDSSIHDNQPCSSSNFQSQISSTNNSYVVTADDVTASTFFGKKKRTSTPNYCSFTDEEKGQCKQRAILSFKLCIRHILLDPTAPYRQCQHRIKPKNKKEEYVLCTNAIRIDRPEIYCSTHLIMKGIMKPKKKGGVNAQNLQSPAYNENLTNSLKKENCDDSTASSKSLNYLEKNSSFMSLHQPMSYAVDSVGNSRTGCESTGSWDQNSSISGSITPNCNFYHTQPQPLIGVTTSSPSLSMHASSVTDANYYDQHSTIQKNSFVENDKLDEKILLHNNYQSKTQLHNQNVTSSHSKCLQQQNPSPLNYNETNSSDNLSQQNTIYHQQQYSTVRHSPTLYINSSQSLHSNVANHNIHYDDHQNYQESEQFILATKQSQQLCNDRQQSISRISKQHPHLAAKLLQPNVTTKNVKLLTDNISNERNHINAVNVFSSPRKEKRLREILTSKLPPPLPQQNQYLTSNSYPLQQITVINNDPLSKVYNTTLVQNKKQQPCIVTIPSKQTSRSQLVNSNQDINSQIFMTLQKGNKTYIRQQVLPQNSQIQSYGNVSVTKYHYNDSQGSYRILNDDETSSIPLNTTVPINLQTTLNLNSNNFQHLLPSQQKLVYQAYLQRQTNYLASLSSNCQDVVSFVEAKPYPVKYKLTAMEDNDNLDEEMKIKRDYLNSDEFLIKRSSKSIKLRQKRQKIRITGAFRQIPIVDSMCKVIEYKDFDSTDLFPLGLEPSDDESSAEENFPEFGDNFPFDIYRSTMPNSFSRLELYLLKKRLRLQSTKLVQDVKISTPIMHAARLFKNSVGAALRIRKMNQKHKTVIGVGRPKFRKCCYKEAKDENNLNNVCKNFCLPLSNFCAQHALSNENQQLFTYCSKPNCQKSILCTDLIVFDGMCQEHIKETNLLHLTGKKFKAEDYELSNLNSPTHVNEITNKNEFVQNNGSKQEFQNYSNTYHNNQIINYNDINIHTTNTNYPDQQNDQLNDDVVEGDVSLASVAKDLGFDGRELTDMLERMPVDETLDDEMGDEEECFLDGIKPEDDLPGMSLGHNWADVEQFLLSEGYHGDHAASQTVAPINDSRTFNSNSNLVQMPNQVNNTMIYR